MHARALRTLLAGAALALVSAPGPAAQAQSLTVRNSWIRGTVPGQQATGAFMEITSKVRARLIAAASPVAGTVEVHGMKMEGGVMRMFPVDGLELPANRPVRLESGGYHVMLLGLKQPLKAGERVPLRLTVEFADRKRESIDLEVEVREVTGAKRHGH